MKKILWILAVALVAFSATADATIRVTQLQEKDGGWSAALDGTTSLASGSIDTFRVNISSIPWILIDQDATTVDYGLSFGFGNQTAASGAAPAAADSVNIGADVGYGVGAGILTANTGSWVSVVTLGLSTSKVNGGQAAEFDAVTIGQWLQIRVKNTNAAAKTIRCTIWIPKVDGR